MIFKFLLLVVGLLELPRNHGFSSRGFLEYAEATVVFLIAVFVHATKFPTSHNRTSIM
jgi:EamA domain-containing membrane protein RarD